MKLTDSLTLLFLLFLISLVIIVFIHLKNVRKREEEVTDTSPIPITPEQPEETVQTEPEFEPSIENGVKLLNAGELDNAEKCLQTVLDQASEAEDIKTLCEARYFLAMVNKEMGDLTLACEHWQIARDLYQELGNEVRIAEIEKYMRENGCPTDWVLNQF